MSGGKMPFEAFTSDDALEMQCPFGRSKLKSDIENNEDQPPGTRCVGWECMAWRFWPGETEADDIRNGHGYCGLVGRPGPQ